MIIGLVLKFKVDNQSKVRAIIIILISKKITLSKFDMILVMKEEY
jgi:hypothetical protein